MVQIYYDALDRLCIICLICRKEVKGIDNIRRHLDEHEIEIRQKELRSRLWRISGDKP